MKRTKPFMCEGEELASVCHWQDPQGPLVIDVAGMTLSKTQAKKLSVWLIDAIREVKEDENKRGTRKFRNSVVIS